jgi:hypothetical protein
MRLEFSCNLFVHLHTRLLGFRVKLEDELTDIRVLSTLLDDFVVSFLQL